MRFVAEFARIRIFSHTEFWRIPLQQSHDMTSWFALAPFLVASLFLIGCGETPPVSPKRKPAAQPTASRDVDPLIETKPVEVFADEFPSVEAALTELQRATELPDGEEQNRAILRCQMWLALKPEETVPFVAQRAADPRQSLAMRIHACRILGGLGPTAIDPLLAIAEKADSSQLRRKALESLGRLKPHEPQPIQRLIALLDDADPQVQWQTIATLQQIGEPAQAAAEKLQHLRQKHPDEHIRVSAGEALKKVDPRRTLVD